MSDFDERTSEVSEPPNVWTPERLPTPWVSYAVIGLSVATTAGLYLLNSTNGWKWTALYGPFVAEGEYWRVVTSLFEHGGPLHLFMNMWAVWGLGVPVERLIGSRRFLGLSLLTCLGSALFVLLFGFEHPTVGASGMILGWAGGLLPLLRREGRSGFARSLLPALFISILPGVSWQGHLGGFVSGLLWGGSVRQGAKRFRLVVAALIILAAVGIYLVAQAKRGAAL